jgi:murein DD-endopeptidase MepM/ murein hydrolase activator NlpD
MRIAKRIVAWWGLGPMLAIAGCSDDGGADPEAWEPAVTGNADSSSGGDPGAESTAAVSTAAASTDAASTDEGDPPATTDDGSTTASETETGTVEEPPLPQGFELPFACGDVWRLDSWGHAPAIDMVREPDQHGTEGAPLFAPAAGIVNQSFYHDNAGNTVQIDHGGGYFTTYIHMESRSVEVGDVLVRGDEIGAVGRTGPTSNNHPHLHFELGIDADGDGEASWGFEGAERVRPWFGGVEYGQDDGLTWRDVESFNCP